MQNIVVVKIGDANSGIMPSPEEEKRIGDIVSKTLALAGRADEIVLVLPYYVDFSVLEPPHV